MDLKQIVAHNILSDRRGRSELARDARMAEYNRLYPELRRLDRQIGICKADILVKLADECWRTVDRAALYDLERKKRVYIQTQGIPVDYDQRIPFCPLCEDTVSVEGKPCTCFQELLVPSIMDASGLGLYSGISFSTYREDYFSKPDKMH